jgi:hypothetical protein
VSPEERTFRSHLAAGPFQAGRDRGDWKCLSIAWPNAVITVRAAPRAGAPDQVALFFDLEGYPRQAPTARPWDAVANAPLPFELWPQGSRASMAFNPGWNNGLALYIPCDRLAFAGHEASWEQQYPAYLWDPKRGIVRYLKTVREILHSSDYTGVMSRAA